MQVFYELACFMYLKNDLDAVPSDHTPFPLHLWMRAQVVLLAMRCDVLGAKVSPLPLLVERPTPPPRS